MKSFFIIVHLIFLCHFSKCDIKPLVNLPNLGQLEGYVEESSAGRKIFGFEGVPYARPPVGALRFEKPEPIIPWNGTWIARTEYMCMQYNEYTPPGQDFVIGDENCLYLNIYTPSLNESANLDVLIYIHGGSFMFNSGTTYRPTYLLDKDIILITLNYRLGPLGFLSSEDDTIPGNNGLKDQLEALKFIKKYISYFGGNPNSITLCGNSAGGASVHFHYLSQKSSGLFQKGISLSGTTLVPWAIMEEPLQKMKVIAENVGCLSSSKSDMKNCLKKRPARQIVNSVKLFQPWLYIPFSPFGPIVDAWSSDPFIQDNPEELIKSHKVYDVPWLVGSTCSEGLYPAEDFFGEKLEDIEKRWNELIPLILDFNLTLPAKQHPEVCSKLREFYLGNSSLSKTTFRKFLPLLSDGLFFNGIQRALKLQSSAVSSSVFCYQFCYRGANSWFNFFDEDGHNYGAAHSDDVPYFLKMKLLPTDQNDNDKDMVKFFVETFLTFIKSGKPNIPWPAVSKNLNNSVEFLRIHSFGNYSVENNLAGNEEFWKSLHL